MALYAIAYAPSISGGTPSNTQKTGSFYIGNLAGGVRSWNGTLTQTGSSGNTQFFASPNANLVGSTPDSGYIMAIPSPSGSGPAPYTAVDKPQFFRSQLSNNASGQVTGSLTDAAFISTCSYILKTYTALGSVNISSPVNLLGCSSVGDCQTQFTNAGWFQSYGFNAPA
jgi:hypothetical protein